MQDFLWWCTDSLAGAHTLQRAGSVVVAGGVNCFAACGIFALCPGIERTPPALQNGLFTTEAPEKSLGSYFSSVQVNIYLASQLPKGYRRLQGDRKIVRWWMWFEVPLVTWRTSEVTLFPTLILQAWSWCSSHVLVWGSFFFYLPARLPPLLILGKQTFTPVKLESPLKGRRTRTFFWIYHCWEMAWVSLDVTTR